MLRLAILLVAGCAAAAAQNRYNGDPQLAAILNEQRYLSGDGTFGAAYQQEDGIDFKEESDVDGNRKGSYSYVDPSGQRRTVHYTAGKNGFQASGDHLPAAPAPVTNPLPEYNPPPQQYSAPAPQQYSAPAPQQYSAPAPQQYSAPVPQHYSAPAQRQYAAPAPIQPEPLPPGAEDDGQYRPELYETENYVAPAPQRSFIAAQPAPQPPQPSAAFNIYPGTQQAQYSGLQSAPASVSQQARYLDPTPAPHRFFPPGKFNLNRSPDGFIYTFSKQ